MAEHSHDHHHAGSGRTLLFALVFTTGFAAVEWAGGLMADSLALLSDAGHMLTDSLSLGVGAFAAWLAKAPASRRHSFGLQRAEVLGALFNVLFMFGVIVYIAWEAMQRLANTPEVAGNVVILIGVLGLLVNIVVAWVLMRGEQSMNVRGALLHVMGDLLGSVAAVAAGGVIALGGPMVIDPVLSLFVCVLILVSALRLMREVTRVLMEGVPAGIDVHEVGQALTDVPGVSAVHDMHIWSLASHSHALAAHIELESMGDWETILPAVRALLAENFAITHTTLQPENAVIRQTCDSHHGCGSGQYVDARARAAQAVPDE